MKITPVFRRISFVFLSLVLGGVVGAVAHADENVAILTGDGGIVQQQCGVQPHQIRVDSSSFSTFSGCFALVKPTGWAAMRVTGSYGVVNNLSVPVSVAFKLPDGAVYWQETVEPGHVKSIDVNNGGSTIVELHVSPVDTSTGASTGTLVPGSANYVSLRSASSAVPGRVVRVTWAGATTAPLTRNSSFLDRLDGSFLVIPGLSDSACVSLQSAAYPGMYLQATNSRDFSLSPEPKAANATWCVNPEAAPMTSARLVWAADSSKALAVTNRGTLTLGPVDSANSRWFSDQALARP